MHHILPPAQEHETHLAVLAGKATTSTTMPPLKTATRAALRCSNSLSYFFIPYQADLPPSDYHHHKVEVHYKGNWKESGFPQKLNLQSTSLDTTTFATTTTLATTSTTTTAAPPLDPSTHVFLTLALLVLFTGLLVGLAAVGLVMKTRWDRYHLHMMPLYQFERDQVVTRKLLILHSCSAGRLGSRAA